MHMRYDVGFVCGISIQMTVVFVTVKERQLFVTLILTRYVHVYKSFVFVPAGVICPNCDRHMILSIWRSLNKAMKHNVQQNSKLGILISQLVALKWWKVPPVWLHLTSFILWSCFILRVVSEVLSTVLHNYYGDSRGSIYILQSVKSFDENLSAAANRGVVDLF